MRDLRLIGVHDDGEHLVVADGDGEEYRIRIDEQLRAAARRDRPRLGQLQMEMESDARPRDVQAMIRAGATIDEVAARTGWSVERIARFEGPVIAEREHVARLAQRVRVRGQGAGASETLGGRAETRLASRGVAPEDVAWDSARDADGQWTVTAAFSAGGKDRRATWWFDAAGLSVVAKNDEARWLSENDTPEGVVPTPHRPTRVFDVEAEEARTVQRGSDELMATMREHARGRRRGPRRRAHTEHVEPPLPLEGSSEGTESSGSAHEPAAPPTPVRGPVPTDAAVPDLEEASPRQARQTMPAPAPGAAEAVATTEAATGPDTPATAPSSPDPAELPQLPPAARGIHPQDAEREQAQPQKQARPEPPQAPDAEATTRPSEGGTAPSASPGTPSPDTPSAGTSSEEDTSSGPDVTEPQGTEPRSPASTPEHPPEESSQESSDDAPASPAAEAPAEETAAEPAPTERTTGSAKRKGRASVPSWDDVMFGAKRDGKS